MRHGTTSVLSPEQDELITRVIGCAIQVHKELGPGFLERIYATALGFELEQNGIPYEREVPLVVNYRDVLPITGQRSDFIVDKSVILDIKAVSRFDPVFEAKMIS
jgi:GxxExxY protein